MTAESGCVDLTQQNLDDGSLTVSPSAAPASGEARVSRVIPARGLAATKFGYPDRVRVIGLKAVVAGDDLAITLVPGLKVGEQVCWTAYS